MATALAGLKTVENDSPARLLFYGNPGIGKTTLAAEFEGTVWLQPEDGAPRGLRLNTFGHITSYDELLAHIGTLYHDPHDFQTVVLDTITATERMIFEKTCADNNVNTIEDIPFGKGYVYAQGLCAYLMSQLDFLRRDRGMTVIILAHADVQTFKDPETVSYDRYELKLHKKIVGPVVEEMDAVILLKKATTIHTEDSGFNKKRNHATGGDTIFMHTRDRPAFVAKNRFGMPSKIMFRLGHGYEALAPYLPGGALSGNASNDEVPEAEEDEAAEAEAAAPPPRPAGRRAPPARA